MFAETLQMERPLDAASRCDYLDTIVNESERLTRLINNVLDYSKIERGQKVYQLEPAALGPVLRRAARTMHYPLQRLGFGCAWRWQRTADGAHRRRRHRAGGAEPVE
jgi:signal transduction histidine kinase